MAQAGLLTQVELLSASTHADYAEYMKKSSSCGTIAKGDVCGVDSSGGATDVFANAISFVGIQEHYQSSSLRLVADVWTY